VLYESRLPLRFPPDDANPNLVELLFLQLALALEGSEAQELADFAS
jgi:hypothetical protein